MPFIPTVGMAKATMFWSGPGGAVAINRLYCGVTAPTTLEQLQEITEALYDVFVAQVIPNTSESWALTGIRAVDAATDDGLFHDDTNLYPIIGSAADAGEPANQVSYTVTLGTGLVGRSQRGRIYGVGLPTSYVAGNRLTDGGRSALQAVWSLVRSAMVTAEHAINVVSFEEAGVPRAAGRPLPVLAVNVRFPLATQRRRLS